MSVTPDSTNRTHAKSTGGFVRPVDALERLFYRYAERNPAHFCIAAEFGETLTRAQVGTALEAVQQRHPLLSVHVEDHPGSRLGFYRADSVAPINLTVQESGESWQSFAAAELAHPFDRSTAPLMRAVLVNGPSGSTIVLTFDYTIADGISSVIAVNDLVDALNGVVAPALGVPPSMEDLIARTLADPKDQGTGASDPRMTEPATIRPFDGTHPYVHTVTLDAADTTQLVNRCRTEQTTVHAAILAAASRAHAMLLGKDFVRAMSPISIRSLINAGDACADYFTCTTTAMSPSDGTAFWDQARAMTAELSIARSAPGVAAASATLQQAVPVDAECATTEQLFTTAMPFDLLVSNLGVQDLHADGAIRPTALWGPVLESQLADFAVGVVTYQGRLRMISCGYMPTEAFLEGVTALLGRAMQPDRESSADVQR